YLYAFLTFIGSVGFVFFMGKRLKPIMGVLSVSLVVLSGVSLYKILNHSSEYKLDIPVISDKPYEKELFTYAKYEKNIVLFVLDMFSGSHLHAILEEFPELKERFEGFIFFDNTLSTTNSTIHSIGSIIGGEHYAVYNMNAREDNLRESITQAFGLIGDSFVKSGYDVSYFMSVAPKPPQYIQAYNQNIFVVQNLQTYTPYFFSSKPDLAQSFAELLGQARHSNISLLLSVGLFRFSPELFFRPRIYNNGFWLIGDKQMRSVMEAIAFASSLYAFTHLHHIDPQSKPTFKYLHTLMTHLPFDLYYDNGKCSFFREQSVWEEYPHTQKMQYMKEEHIRDYYKHYDTEVCALVYLADYVQWLKDNDIYDNTQIFILSDHSGHDSIGIPEMIVQNEGRPDALFLFKDFESRGKLQVNSDLMTNYDAPSIFCESLSNPCPYVGSNILKAYPEHRAVISTIPTHWDIERHKSNQWILNAIYEVKGNIYEAKNWRDITQEVADGKMRIDNKPH
ncbi:hypothetical protein CQA63_09195, partial [Helicobacter marmotae]